MNDKNAFDVILGNSNKRFSGVTSTMLQTLKYQRDIVSLRVLGRHHLPSTDRALSLSFWQAVKACRTKPKNGSHYVFHARRNDEMLQALLLKHVFGVQLKILFTSTAQRYHSKFTCLLMSKMDAVISTCRAAANYLKTPPCKIIPHGIDTDVFYPKTDGKQLDELNGELHIGVFGRVREQKGSDLIIDAALKVLPKHPNVKITFIGAITPDRADFVSDLRSKIADADLNDRIRFTGELSFEEIPKRMRSMHLVLALSRTEGFGLTVLEALSSGVAVLASDAGAWPDIIENGVHGSVVPAGDLASTAIALDQLLQEPDKLRQMGAAGRAHVLANYTIRQEAIALCSLYQDIQNARI